jgi:hypothetical protein
MPAAGAGLPAVVRHEPGNGEGDEVLGAGSRGDPLVGVHAGERLVRPDEDHLAAPSLRVGAALDEAVGVIHGREPGLEEVGAEADDDLGVAEVVDGHGIDAVDHAAGRAERLVRERLPADALRADAGGELVDEPVHGAGVVAGEQDRAATVLLQRGGEAALTVVPGEDIPVIGAAAGEGRGTRSGS